MEPAPFAFRAFLAVPYSAVDAALRFRIDSAIRIFGVVVHAVLACLAL